MEKHQRDKIILIAICAAIVLGIFLWPLSALGIAWPYGGVPDAVRIRHTPFDDSPSIDVTLPADESAALIEHLQGYRARFVWFGRQYVFHTEFYSITLSQPKTGWAETSLDEQGTISQQNPQLSRGRGTFRLYGSAAEELLQICSDWTGPDSKYPGVAFLKEFFAIGKDGRSDKVQLDAPDGEYGAGDPLALYDGLKEYMTEHGFNEVVMGRSLYRLEYLCKQKGDGWRCWDIEVTPASEPGYYSYRVGLVRGPSENYWITGNYYASEDGLVDSFFIELSGEIAK